MNTNTIATLQQKVNILIGQAQRAFISVYNKTSILGKLPASHSATADFKYNKYMDERAYKKALKDPEFQRLLSQIAKLNNFIQLKVWNQVEIAKEKFSSTQELPPGWTLRIDVTGLEQCAVAGAYNLLSSSKKKVKVSLHHPVFTPRYSHEAHKFSVWVQDSDYLDEAITELMAKVNMSGRSTTSTGAVAPMLVDELVLEMEEPAYVPKHYPQIRGY